MNNYVIFIPARDNSKRLPRKNMKEMLGIPLVGHTLDTAMEVKKNVERSGSRVLVVLTTNSHNIVGWASSRYGRKIHIHLRDEKMAQDHVQTDEVCVDVLRTLELQEHPVLQDLDIHFGILLQPTSPTRTVQDVLNCIMQKDEYLAYDRTREGEDFCVLTAEKADGFYWQSVEPYTMEHMCLNDDPRFRQGKQWITDPQPILHENGAVYLFPLNTLSRKRIYRMPPYLVVETAVIPDIDTQSNFDEAEAVLESRL